MISVELLYNRLSDLTLSGTSGFFTEDTFNNNLYSVQYSVLSILSDNYENNQKVADALVNHIEDVAVTSLGTGKLFATDIITALPNYYRALSLQYNLSGEPQPSYKVTTNSVAMSLTSAIRKPDLAKGRTLYSFIEGNIQTYPKSAGNSYVLTYIKKPELAKISFTTQSDEDNDYLVVDTANTVDIEFPEGLFNIFVYLMLESMGIEQKESLSAEYSQLGINREIQLETK